MKMSGRILFMVFALMALQGIHYYPLMPQKMATHFDGAGNANGTMDRADFFLMYYGLTAFLSLLFIFLPRLIAVFPDSMINLPHKEYWFTPENRPKADEIVRTYLVAMGAAVVAFLMGIGQLTFLANLDPVAKMPDAAWFFLAGFMLFMLVWSVKFILAFRVPKERIPGAR